MNYPEEKRKDGDSEILEIYFRDNDTGFRLIVRKYTERLYRHIRKIVISHDDTDDVLQNVFVKVWKSLHAFRGDSELFTWLYRIATNEALNFINGKNRHSLIPIKGNVERQLSDLLDNDPWCDGDKLQLKLQKALLTLPEKQRIVFNMKYFDDITYEEMAAILDTSAGALKASYHHAVKKVEKYLLEN